MSVCVDESKESIKPVTFHLQHQISSKKVSKVKTQQMCMFTCSLSPNHTSNVFNGELRQHVIAQFTLEPNRFGVLCFKLSPLVVQLVGLERRQID